MNPEAEDKPQILQKRERKTDDPVITQSAGTQAHSHSDTLDTSHLSIDTPIGPKTKVKMLAEELKEPSDNPKVSNKIQNNFIL